MLSDHCSELVVCSRQRWHSGPQRSHQLASRLGRGVRTVYVEEPRLRERPAAGLRLERRVDQAPVTTAWLEVEGPDRRLGFGDPVAAAYPAALAGALDRCGPRIVWIDTAMALPFVDALDPDLVVYDVVDDVAVRSENPPELAIRHRAALRRADLVFTGSTGLQRDVVGLRATGVHCHPDGVDREHFVQALRRRPARRRRPVAGYVGPIDERLDLELVRALARLLPRWDVKLVGPVSLDPACLPREPNLSWLAPCTYGELPDLLAGVDVALLPYAHNDTSRSIGPGPVLEALAAGLPVVSTSWPEVVAHHAARVELRDDAEGVAAACQAAVDAPLSARRRPDVERFLDRHSWDVVAGAMAATIRAGLDRSPALVVPSTG
jgi:glycosyltransferase involved in cell wall biosynthesis